MNFAPGIGLLALSAFLASLPAQAQPVEQFSPWSVGDKATFVWKLGPKEHRLEQEVISSDDSRVVVTERALQRSFTMEFNGRTMDFTSSICLTNGQQCQFEPNLHVLDLPLDKGKKWSIDFTVKGEAFTARIKQDRVIEKTEKIKLPAGEFETIRIAAKSKLQGSDKAGNAFSGNETFTEWWWFTPSGKALMVKYEYRNSFGEKASRDASSVEFK